MSQAIALLSSGLDSTVALAAALQHNLHISLALTFDYGQKAAMREIEQSAQIARHYGIRHQVLSLPWMKEFSSGLTSSKAFPHLQSHQLDDLTVTQTTAKAVWVPNRNGVFLEIAAGIAENSGAQVLLVGFNREEATTFPDNSESYLQAINRAFSFSTANGVRVESPTSHLNKREIVSLGKDLKVPFSLLWSCYGAEPIMCGLCESCQRLKRALSDFEGDHGAKFNHATF